MKIIDCPYCNQPGAEKSLFKTRCPNPACPAYDPEMRGGLSVNRSTTEARTEMPARPVSPESAQPKPGELLPQAGEGAPGRPESDRKTVEVKAKGGGCGGALLLWVAAYFAFRYALRHGSYWWGLVAFFVFLAWSKSRQETARAARRPAATREIDKETGKPVIVYEEPFDAGGEHGVEIRYKNWKGETKTFVGARRTMRRRGRHLSLRVAPNGVRIALALDRIQNLPEAEAATPK